MNIDEKAFPVGPGLVENNWVETLIVSEVMVLSATTEQLGSTHFLRDRAYIPQARIMLYDIVTTKVIERKCRSTGSRIRRQSLLELRFGYILIEIDGQLQGTSSLFFSNVSAVMRKNAMVG
jgi:hypothetical protein